MHDIYIELKNIAQQNNIYLDERKRSSAKDLLSQEFRAKANILRKKIALVKNNNQQIKMIMHNKMKFLTHDKSQQLSQSLQAVLQQNEEMNTQIKSSLLEIITETQENIKKDQDGPETRAQINLKDALQNEILAVLKETSDIQALYRQKVKQSVSKQIDILDPNHQLNQEQRDQILVNPNGMQQLLVHSTLGQGQFQLQHAVMDIMERHEDIQRLEQSVTRVFQMFSDIAMLVQSQGEKIISIEENFLNAKDYVEKTEAQLVKQKEEHISSKKKKCCIIIIGLIILAVVATPFISNYIKK